MKLPKVLFTETTNLCNRACKWCSWGHVTSKPPLREMSARLFKRILTDVREHVETLEAVNLYGINEPLLDSQLIERIEQVKDVFGAAQVVRLVTNGTLLELKHIQAFASFANVQLHVNIYDDATFDRIQLVRAQGSRFPELADWTFHIWDDRSKDTWENQLVLHERDCAPARIRRPVSGPCTRPANAIVVRCDGKLNLCCTDIDNLTTWGELQETPEWNLVEMWRAATTTKSQALLRGTRTGPCARCSRVGMDYL